MYLLSSCRKVVLTKPHKYEIVAGSAPFIARKSFCGISVWTGPITLRISYRDNIEFIRLWPILWVDAAQILCLMGKNPTFEQIRDCRLLKKNWNFQKGGGGQSEIFENLEKIFWLRFNEIWGNLAKFDEFWRQNLVKFNEFWPNLTAKFDDEIWPNLVKFDEIWQNLTNLKFGEIWSNQEKNINSSIWERRGGQNPENGILEIPVSF